MKNVYERLQSRSLCVVKSSSGIKHQQHVNLFGHDDGSTESDPSTLVFDIGKTNLKVLVMLHRSVMRDVRKTDNESQTGPPYAHLNVAGA